MDTISITLIFNWELKECEIQAIEKFRFISSINKGRENNSYIFKISYPKFKGENNATLIHDPQIILECNKKFVDVIRKISPTGTIKMKINRVDIPFTILMKEDKHFLNYEGIFYLMAIVYFSIYPSNKIKAFSDFINKEIQTVYFQDGNNYNNKIIIYNQAANLKDKYNNFNEILKKHPDLPYRIRIEVSKKISNVQLKLEEFKDLDLYTQYCNSFLDYILKVFYNDQIIEQFKEKNIERWEILLNEMGSGKSYLDFYMLYTTPGDSLVCIKKALKKVYFNKKSLESAVKSTKKSLQEVEFYKKFMILDIFSEYERIKNELLNYRI